MNKVKQIIKYLLADYFTATIAWALFFLFRKVFIESQKHNSTVINFTDNFYLGVFLIPVFWILLYALTGTYKDIFRRSRLIEMFQTLVISLVGVLILFFALILDDDIVNYKNYYRSFTFLLGIHFLLTAIGRFILSSITAYKIHNRIIGFNTLIMGSNENAVDLYEELESQKKSSGFRIIGFVHVNGGNGHLLKKHLKHLGHSNDVKNIIEEHHIEEVIIAMEKSEHHKIQHIVNDLSDTNVRIKVIPDMYDILSGSVKMSSIFGAPLIEVNAEIMPVWEQSLKRIMDIVISIFAIILLMPVYICLAILVKISSPGPIFYSHERVGKHGKSFVMFKFRSMYKDAEKNGPALSSKNDSRITPLGKVLRRTRLDETPQFFNVLKGDMALVGPRPERRYFIEQIVKKAPHYKHLHKVRPGITSWGQVKFGYAENVDEMVERLKYDVLYIENMSLLVDIKILIYTILIVLQGRGK